MIPKAIILPLLLFSVVFISFQYSQLVSRRNILNIRFALAVGGIVTAMLVNFCNDASPILSVAFLVLALCWFGASIRLWRLMPAPGQPGRRGGR